MARRSICVFCSSSNDVDPAFFAAARSLGQSMAARGHQLVFGGTNVGLMGEIARAAHDGGAQVIGVMPEAFNLQNMAFELATELIVTRDLRERKATMEARAEAFVALPGGLGTLEEVFEIMTLKQLRFHSKPVVLLNSRGFYDHLVQFFERLREEHFVRGTANQLYYVAADANDALDYIERYEPVELEGNWF